MIKSLSAPASALKRCLQSDIHIHTTTFACANGRILGRHVSSSSGTAFLNSFTTESIKDSIKDSVKSSLLEEAARPDSRLWKRPQIVNGNHAVNGHQANGHAPLHDAAAGGVNHTTVQEEDGLLSLQDPLDDLYVPNATTRYWPLLPPAIQDSTNSNNASSSTSTVVDPFQLSKVELDHLSQSIRQDLIGTDHPVLNKAAAYFFQATADGGKKVRPMMVLLLSRALSDTVGATPMAASHNNDNDTGNDNPSPLFAEPMSWQRSDLPSSQRRLAEISEMIHTASLFHDDVIDGADTRRGVPAVHMVFGNKMAILAGDYLLARASICLARLRNVLVVETMSTIIEHLVRGEVMQMRGTAAGHDDDNDNVAANLGHDRMVYYLRKNFYKTGSLMANSCRSTALLGEYPPELVSASYRFGKHVGMAFQLVDDVLDFEGSLASLGKPSLADLKAGLATAPVLLAAQEHPELWNLMDRKFKEEGDVERAVEYVHNSSAMEQTKELARVHAEQAMDAVLNTLSASPYRDALVVLANKVVARTK